MEEDAFFKPFFSNIKFPSFSSNDENWDTIKSNSYVSPDGNIKIHSTFRSKSFGFGGEDGESDSRPSILTGPDAPMSSFNKISQKMDQEMKSAFEGFKDFEKKFENFGARMIGNPKIISEPKIEADIIEIQPQLGEVNTEQAELDQNVFYLLCTMAFLLLLLSAILGAMTWLYRKRGKQQMQRNHVDVTDDAPPTYHSATTQAIVKMTPEVEPLKANLEECCPPPYKN